MIKVLFRVLPLLMFMAMSAGAAESPPLVRSAADGAWSDPKTWEGNQVPASGVRVQVREGHTVIYDLDSDQPIRSIHVAGMLRFASDRNTRLDVGLIKVQAGDDASENGFDCDAHMPESKSGGVKPALIVGTPEEPIPAGTTATIRLTYIEGLDRETCPGIICCGGRMEFHGAKLKKTWTKLRREAYRNEPIILLQESEVSDWKPGDHLVITGTTRQFGYKDTRTHSVVERPSTEERVVVEIKRYVESGLVRVTLDKPLEFDHRAEENYRAEVANLTRNVVIESADPDGVRGHTMFHRNSAGSISYAEFRHLGKEGILGKYSLHFHLAGETMRGTSVVGASFWDSKNRWITIHGTSYLVIRDCVGYKSVGHGFFLEDGTETRNVFDGNLAVMALRGKPLPEQVLPYDQNLGSGFWWANSLNTFTNNSAAECDQDGYRFEVTPIDGFDPKLPVLQPDGSKSQVDIRTLPFLRFENNEAHCMRFFGLNLGGFNDGGVPPYPGEKPVKSDPKPETAPSTRRETIRDVDGIGPDANHPFLIRDYRAWDTHWAFHAGSPSVRADGMDLYDSQYGIWRSVIDNHEYGNLRMEKIISRGIFFPRPGRAKSDEIAFLRPVDDLPPATVITEARPKPESAGRWIVQGTCSDDYVVTKVTVNGQSARPVRPNFAEWEIEIDAPTGTLKALAEDEAGNVEKMPHVLKLDSVPNVANARQVGH